MLQIYYLPDQRLVEVGQDAVTILDASLAASIPHTHVCGGNGRCSTCRVFISEGLEHCTPRTPAEQELAKRLHFTPQMRLACQTELQGEGQICLRRLSLDAEDLALFHDQAYGKIMPAFVGSEQQVAILFADIRGFTAFSEALLPYDVIYVLNRYFQQMGEIIHRQGGVINVYMGDGFMALFGVENPDRAAERAVRAGVEMLAAIERLNPRLESLYRQRLRIGIGIHFGNAVIGTIGSPQNPQWTAIGDAVNLASRIESANKELGTQLLISEATRQAIATPLELGQQFQVVLRGKSGEYCLHEVRDITPAPVELHPAIAQPPQHFKKVLPNWLSIRGDRLWQWLQQWFRL